jgi:hypothetical protein
MEGLLRVLRTGHGEGQAVRDVAVVENAAQRLGRARTW